jgi:putative transposase
MITSDFENDLYQYMTGIIRNHGHKMIAINGLQDHVHVLAGIRPKESISGINLRYLRIPEGIFV